MYSHLKLNNLFIDQALPGFFIRCSFKSTSRNLRQELLLNAWTKMGTETSVRLS